MATLFGTPKQQLNESEDRFAYLSLKKDSDGQELADANNVLMTIRMEVQRLKRRSPDLENLLKDAETAATTARLDTEVTMEKIRCPICFTRGLQIVTKCGHLFSQKCLEKHAKKDIQTLEPHNGFTEEDDEAVEKDDEEAVDSSFPCPACKCSLPREKDVFLQKAKMTTQ